MQLLIALIVAVIVSAAPSHYPPCLTDETGPEIPACTWNAATQGNGQGQSFTWTGQEVILSH